MTRPTPVTVFGILNLAWGAYNVLSALLGAVAMVAMPFLFTWLQKQPGGAAAFPKPMIDLMTRNLAYLIAVWATLVLNGCASLVLFVSGIGLLQMKAWARKLALCYAVFMILFSTVTTLLNSFVLNPMMNRAMGASTPLGFAILTTVLGLAFALVYPILLLVYMTRGNIAGAFETQPAVVEVQVEPP